MISTSNPISKLEKATATISKEWLILNFKFEFLNSGLVLFTISKSAKSAKSDL